MIVIIQQPSGTSFARNLASLWFTSTAEVQLSLQLAGREILAESYAPPIEGDAVKVDLRQVVHESLSVPCESTMSFRDIPTAVGDFTVSLTENSEKMSFSFRAIRGGIARLNDKTEDYLRSHFLSHQPRSKRVLHSSPEYLNYYAVEPCRLRIASAGVVLVPLDLEAGKFYTFCAQYNVLAGKFEHPAPTIRMWIEAPDGRHLTYEQTFTVTSPTAHPEFFIFENSQGGIDGFWTSGRRTLAAKHEHKLSDINTHTEEYDADTERTYTQHTGLLTVDERSWLLDFFPSPQKKIYTDQGMLPIAVASDRVSYKEDDPTAGYSFDFRFADTSSLLSEQHTAQVMLLNVGNHTPDDVPATLADTPSAILESETIIPVQHPYGSKFSRVSVGSLASFLRQDIERSVLGRQLQSKFVGYFPTFQALSAARPIPAMGEVAWVGTPYPGVTYAEGGGAWHSTNTAPSPDVVQQVISPATCMFEDIDKMNDPRRSPGVYNVLHYTISPNKIYSIGFLVIISDDMAHGVHQLFYTRASLTPEGAYTGHTDRQTKVYERAYYTSRSSVPAEMFDKWTLWSSLMLAYIDSATGIPYLRDATGKNTTRIVTEDYLNEFLKPKK